MKKKLVFMWLNFGPSHEDRCEYIAENFKNNVDVFGIEIYGKSDTYDWETKKLCSYKKFTLFSGKTKVLEIYKFFRLFGTCIKLIPAVFFFCNYESMAVLFTALILKTLGQSIVVMNDSKFDDYSRNIKIELVKYLFYSPYRYAIGASVRSIEYLKFFCFKEKNIFLGYNSLSTERIKKYKSDDVYFCDRHFIIVARLVPKKNIKMALDAYKIYVAKQKNARRLKIIGDGPLLSDLTNYATLIGINEYISWTGFLQYQEVYKLISESVCLILVSTEEQFGHVIIEAMALGIPCITSTQVGSREEYIISGDTGFIVEEDNPSGLAYFMEKISENEKFWDSMSDKCLEKSKDGDVSKFGAAVKSICSASN